jgi:hypothetical protein
MRFSAQGFGCFDEIVDAPLALRQICPVDLVDAVGNPICNERLGASIP